MKVVLLSLYVSLCFGLGKLEAERVYSLEEGNSLKDFVLAEDEVYVESKAFSSFRLLQKRLKENWPQAVLMEEKGNAALVRFPTTQKLEEVLRDSDLKQNLGRAELLPVLYLKDKSIRGVESRRVVTGEVLIKAVSQKAAMQLSQKFGQPTVSSTQLKESWVLHYANALEALEQVERMRKQGIKAQVILAREMSRRLVPNDKLYKKQWNLNPLNLIFSTPNIPFLDINVESAWDSVTGQGITIAIVDDGLQVKHPDLKAHVATKFEGLNLNLNGGRSNNPNPKKNNYHGTACAGMAAAVGNNEKGVAGVAFNAKLAGIRLIARQFTDIQAAFALSWQRDKISIYSNSWGPLDGGINLDESLPEELTLNAIQQGVTTGRNGRGNLFFWAAGNGRGSGDHSNYDGYANLRYVFAIGAYDSFGKQAFYSESGANLLVVAPSDGGNAPVVSTDLKGKRGSNKRKSYTNFGGTSAAAPQVAGVAALILERNPNLGWRDVKEILIRTANQQSLEISTNGVGSIDSVLAGDEGFMTNGGGFAFSHSYGAGRVSAAAAVGLAGTWTNLAAEEASPLLSYSNLDLSFSKTNDVIATFLFTTNVIQTNEVQANINLRVETVTFTADIKGAKRNNLAFELTSPSGMKTIVPPRSHDEEFGLENWTFSSVRHWGESSEGIWTLRAKNLADDATIVSQEGSGKSQTNIAEVVSLSLQLFGTKIE